MVMCIQMILTPDVENKNVYCCLGVKVGGGQEGWDVLMCRFFFLPRGHYSWRAGRGWVAVGHGMVWRNLRPSTMHCKETPVTDLRPLLSDQTPTPTRFLKNCEEVGLFSELDCSFEHEFRKAQEEENSKRVGGPGWTLGRGVPRVVWKMSGAADCVEVLLVHNPLTQCPCDACWW